MVSRDIYSLYVEEYIGLYFKILRTKGSATLYARFIKAQVCDRLLSAIKIRFNKGLVGWGSRGVQSGGSLLPNSSSQGNDSGSPLGFTLSTVIVNFGCILNGDDSFFHHGVFDTVD
jgi:hypothetical protein